MDTCLFCEITAGREHAYKVYDNEWVCCFLDKYPINKGHVLVTSKTHYREFTDLDEKSLTEVILAAQKIAEGLESVYNCDGITIMQNNGLFKDVDHYHMHVFPRYKDDGFSWVEPDNQVDRNEFVEVRRILKEGLS
ncbi:HIT family protein [Pseudalkalibacillus sp. SCS-8]|uniref:HIT family protein n=1 Tax=Pseudalkalibacillus nanhaiensis TaxID=3115291 RepID=UPI0032DAA428